MLKKIVYVVLFISLPIACAKENLLKQAWNKIIGKTKPKAVPVTIESPLRFASTRTQEAQAPQVPHTKEEEIFIKQTSLTKKENPPLPNQKNHLHQSLDRSTIVSSRLI